MHTPRRRSRHSFRPVAEGCRRLGDRLCVGLFELGDRGQHLVVVEDLLEVDAGVSAAGIGVVHELDVGAALSGCKRHPQRVEQEIGAASSAGSRSRPPTSCRPRGGDVVVDRSGGLVAVGSGVVVRQGLPRRLAPWMPWARISRLTRSRPTSTPARLSASHGAGSRRRSSWRPARVRRAERPLVLHGPRRALPAGALVVGGRRHAEGRADRLDAEAAAVLFDKRLTSVGLRRARPRRTPTPPFKISFARRSS